jgi:histidinol-phosphate/aromatic aminotransferase/cobyric acid decarboxylase-like protein
MTPLSGLLENNLETPFLVDEAFVDIGGSAVARLVPRYDNLLVTRTLSKAHSLAVFRVGYAILPKPVTEDLNASNDAYPLARPSQAAAISTLRADAEIRNRVERLRSWTDRLAEGLEPLGVTTHPTERYVFLADFSPHDASDVAARLRDRDIFVKALADDRLGPGYMRVATARPEDNQRVASHYARYRNRSCGDRDRRWMLRRAPLGHRGPNSVGLPRPESLSAIAGTNSASATPSSHSSVRLLPERSRESVAHVRASEFATSRR